MYLCSRVVAYGTGLVQDMLAVFFLFPFSAVCLVALDWLAVGAFVSVHTRHTMDTLLCYDVAWTPATIKASIS